MEVNGKIIQKLPLQSGTSKTGNPWSKQVYILETFDAYPKKVAFDFFGERINQYDNVCAVGATITLSYDIESREFNGRWYTDIRGWKAEPYTPPMAQGQPAAAPAAPAGAPAAAPASAMETPPPPGPADFAAAPGTDDDLPF